jgi:predicted HD phosphohydrolase
MYSQAEAKRFLERPFARDAVALRRWDDLAKVPGTRTPGIAHYARALSALAATV